MKTNLALLVLLIGLIAAYYLTLPVSDDPGLVHARSQLLDREQTEELRRALRIVFVPGQALIADAEARSKLDSLDDQYIPRYELPETVRIERQYQFQPGTPRGAFTGWHVTTHGDHPAQGRVFAEMRRGFRNMHRGDTIIEAEDVNPRLLRQYGLDDDHALRVEIFTPRMVEETRGGQQGMRIVKEPLIGLLIGRTPARTAEARESRSPVGFLSDDTEARFLRLARIEPGEDNEPGRFVYDTEIRLIDNVPANLIRLANINEWIDRGVTKVGGSRMPLEDIYRIDFGGTALDEPFSLQRLGGADADTLWRGLDEYRSERELGEALGRTTDWYLASPGKTLIGDAYQLADSGQVRAAMSDISGYQAHAFHSVNEGGEVPESPYLRIRIIPAQELMRVRRAEQVLNERGLWAAIGNYVGEVMQQRERDPQTEDEDVVVPVEVLLEGGQRHQMDEDDVVTFLLNNLRPNFLVPVFARDDALPPHMGEVTVTFPYGRETRELAAVRLILAGHDPAEVQRHLLETMHEILPNASEVLDFHDFASTLLYLVAEKQRAPVGSREHNELVRTAEQFRMRLGMVLRELDAYQPGLADGDVSTRADLFVETARRKATLRAHLDSATLLSSYAFWEMLVETVRDTGTRQVLLGDLLERAQRLGIGRDSMHEFVFSTFAQQMRPLTASDIGLDSDAGHEAFVEQTVDGREVRIVAFVVTDTRDDSQRMRFLQRLYDDARNLTLSDDASQSEIRETLEAIFEDLFTLIELEQRLVEATLAEDDDGEEVRAARDVLHERFEDLLGEDMARYTKLAAEIGESRARAQAGERAWEDVRLRYREQRELAVSRFWRAFYDSFVNPHEIVVVLDEQEAAPTEGDSEDDEEVAAPASYRITSNRLHIPNSYWYEMTSDVAQRWAFGREYFKRDVVDDDEDVEPEHQPQTQPAGIDWDAAAEIVAAPANPRVTLWLRDESGFAEDALITLELFEDLAPNAVANFLRLVQEGYYDGLLVHHLEEGDVLHFGDATTREGIGDVVGTHTPGFELPGEFHELLGFDLPAPTVIADELEPGQGRVAMLAGSADGRAHGAQLLITLSGSTARNEQNLLPFGQVVEGMHLLTRLALLTNVEQDPSGYSVPSDPIRIERARVDAQRDHAYDAERLPLASEEDEENGDVEVDPGDDDDEDDE